MAQFTTAASRDTAQVAAAMGTKVHINAVVNLVRDTAMSKDASKCPKWTLRALNDGAKEETLVDKLVEGGMTTEQAEAHVAECLAHIVG